MRRFRDGPSRLLAEQERLGVLGLAALSFGLRLEGGSAPRALDDVGNARREPARGLLLAIGEVLMVVTIEEQEAHRQAATGRSQRNGQEGAHAERMRAGILVGVAGHIAFDRQRAHERLLPEGPRWRRVGQPLVYRAGAGARGAMAHVAAARQRRFVKQQQGCPGDIGQLDNAERGVFRG